MKDKLFRFAFRLLQNVQEAEDAVQDVMAGIWIKRAQWDQWNNMEAYCMTATRNNCLDRLRKQRLVPVEEERGYHVSSHEKDPYEKMMGKEIIQQVKKCIADLPENQQMVVRLREMEGFSYNEIAGILGMTIDQVKINLFRGRNAIKKIFINDKEDGWNTQS